MNPNVPHSLPEDYFVELYGREDDPWQFETSPYEDAKYAATVSALPRAQYDSALEIGCSIGVLTARLAPRCRRLLSVDFAEKALRRAQERCRDLPQVRFEKRQMPRQFPDETFDLILLSEVGYYWDAAELAQAQDKIDAHLSPGGHLLLVHWLPFVDDYPLTGDEVHDSFLARAEGGSRGDLPLRPLMGRREEKYRMNLFERV